MVSICKPGGEGMMVPATSAEQEWPAALRAVLYGAGLLYAFLGVAMVSDIFMSAIEAVTNRKVSRVLPGGRRKTAKLWNETVATLTLMALGSSAPEIFLSVIDVVKKEFHFGDLGPSTIVGSAAFNLLVIIAVCILAIPKGEVRIIKNLPAFYITALFSIVAYLWMAFILLYSSEGIVEVWEALTTLLLLVPLVYSSYKVDRGDVDGLLRLLHIVSAEDEAIAAKPQGANVKWKKRPIGQVQAQPLPPDETDEFTIVWHNRVDGWQAQTVQGKDEAEKRYAALPVAVTRCMFGSDGAPAKSWFLSRRWGRHLSTFYASLKGGAYLKFASETCALEASAEERTVEIAVNRTGSLDGEASCTFRTESMSAVAGYDYEAVEGALEFSAFEERKILSLKIFGRHAWRHESAFLLILEEAEGGVTFDPTDDGGAGRAILTVKLAPSHDHYGDGSLRKALDRLIGIYGASRGFEDWKDQLASWVYVNGSKEEQQEASASDWFFHIIGLPWKFLSALLPPTSFFGGWLAFYTALIGIAVLTALVSDLSELLGCVIGVPDIVTAISLVALGTSMPDLFASLSAAKEDETADASVVNVTGSNSVNVFLGLGIPWSIAAIYWQAVGRTEEWAAMYPEEAARISGAAFVVKSSSLGYSVLVFCFMFVFAILLLHMRRKWVGAELGGPAAPKYACAVSFVFYWLLFVALVSWRVIRWEVSQLPENLTSISDTDVWLEGILVHGVGVSAFLTCTAVTLALTKRHRVVNRMRPSNLDKEKDESVESWSLSEREREVSVGSDLAASQIRECHKDISCESKGSQASARSELDRLFGMFHNFRC